MTADVTLQGISEHVCGRVMGRKCGSPREASPATSGLLAAGLSRAFQKLPTLQREVPVPPNKVVTPALQISAVFGHRQLLQNGQ